MYSLYANRYFPIHLGNSASFLSWLVHNVSYKSRIPGVEVYSKSNSMNNDDSKLTLVAAVIVIQIIFTLVFLTFREKSVTTGYISRMWWNRTVYEMEDYQTYDCWTEEEDDGNSNNNDNKEVIKCAWVTHTRVTNTWRSEGLWYAEPYWPEYTIAKGRYESRIAFYYMDVKTDDYGTLSKTINFGEYQSLKPEKVLILHLNYFNNILYYEVK